MREEREEGGGREDRRKRGQGKEDRVKEMQREMSTMASRCCSESTATATTISSTLSWITLSRPINSCKIALLHDCIIS